MNPTDPCVPIELLPDGSRPLLLAEHQEEYQTLPVVRTPDGKFISRWTLTPEERAEVAAGADVYLTVWAGRQQPPVQVTVGPVDWNG
jgi:hypothetical protein